MGLTAPEMTVLVGGQSIGWSLAVLPVWVLMISGYILMDNFAGVRGQREDGGHH